MRMPCAPFFDVRGAFRRIVKLGEAESRIESDASRKRKAVVPGLAKGPSQQFAPPKDKGRCSCLYESDRKILK